MRAKIVYLHDAAPGKPAVGEPCNGCGLCCAQETCPAGRLRFLQAGGPCPALEWHAPEQRYRCGLLSAPERYISCLPISGRGWAKRLFARWISAGSGCDCSSEISR